MGEAEKKMEVLRGQPVQIILGGKPYEVFRFNIETQIDVIKSFSDNSSGDMAANMKMMIFVISKAVGFSEKEIGENASMDEVLDAFKIIYDQNGFSNLTKKVADLSKAINPQ